jgi:hypothetical protein
LSLRKLIDLLTSKVFGSVTAGAVSRLDVLNSICTTPETLLATNWASDISRPMDLHVHIQLILCIEFTVAFSTLKLSEPRHASGTTGALIALSPLIAAEFTANAPFITLRAITTHFEELFAQRNRCVCLCASTTIECSLHLFFGLNGLSLVILQRVEVLLCSFLALGSERREAGGRREYPLGMKSSPRLRRDVSNERAIWR